MPSRPTKKSDKRSRCFEGDSYEVEAIEPDVLRELVEDHIREFMSQDSYDRMLEEQERDREELTLLAAKYSE